VTRAADLLVSKWGTTHYPLPDDMKAPFIRQIRLPDLKKYPNNAEVDYVRKTYTVYKKICKADMSPTESSKDQFRAEPSCYIPEPRLQILDKGMVTGR